ncbi:M15 family metallopeptidase [Cypionkella sp.]|uniref:M15 family metallopeptidase n=1 Tax=Cypionkella sp. TaxID=2811411 RepID=UPI003752E51E
MANWADTQKLGDSSTAEWQKANLVEITSSNGQTWQVYKDAAPAFTGFLQELEATGYLPKSSGGYNYRPIRGGTKLSQHAFGNAIDIGAAANAMGSHATDMPSGVSDIAAKYGLEWGGNWKRPDPMHFEWTGNGAGQPAASAPNSFAGIPQQPPQNALAQVQQPEYKTTQLDPRAFMTPQNQLALLRISRG